MKKNDASKLRVQEFFPGMKISQGSRSNAFSTGYNLATDSFSNKEKVSQGASMKQLKEKYFGKADIQGGPQGDTRNDHPEDQIFTEDAQPEANSDDQSLDVSLIEPESDSNQDALNNEVVGKKTVISKDGVPKAVQG